MDNEHWDELVQFIRDDDTDQAERLLASGKIPDINRPCLTVFGAGIGVTALEYAAWCSGAEMVRLLLRHGATVGGTAASAPVGQHQQQGLQPASTSMSQTFGMSTTTPTSSTCTTTTTVLDRAIFNRESVDPTPVVRVLLEENGPRSSSSMINQKNKFGWTPLHCAAGVLRNIELTRLLLRHGADVSIADPCGSTVLDLVANVDGFPHGEKSPACMRLLLEHGANVHHRNKRGRTLLECTAAKDYSDLVQVLLQFGADLASRNQDDGKIPFEVACEKGSVSSTFLLLQSMVGNGSIKFDRLYRKELSVKRHGNRTRQI